MPRTKGIFHYREFELVLSYSHFFNYKRILLKTKQIPVSTG